MERGILKPKTKIFLNNLYEFLNIIVVTSDVVARMFIIIMIYYFMSIHAPYIFEDYLFTNLLSFITIIFIFSPLINISREK